MNYEMNKSYAGPTPPPLNTGGQSLDAQASRVHTMCEGMTAHLEEMLARLDGGGVKGNPDQARPQMPLPTKLDASLALLDRCGQLMGQLHARLFA